MIITILKIRLIQAFRVVKEIGLLRALILIAILAFVSFLILQTVKQAKNSYIVSIVSGLMVLMIHASRKDKRFLRINFNRNYFIFLVEYFLLVFPILIICLIFKDWKNVIILSLLCLMIPRIYLNLGLSNVSSALKILLNPFSSNLDFKLNVRVPIKNPKAFEWISGFRRYFIILIPVYILFLAFSFKPYVAPAGLIILSIMVSGFYFYGESREFMELFSNNYRTFLVQKIKLSITYLFILFIPIVIISLIFQPGTWYFIIGAVIISLLIQIITIIFKYALFIENTDLGHNGIIVFVNVLCLFLPFLWPLPIIMGTRYYLKAQNNLKKYFNDIH